MYITSIDEHDSATGDGEKTSVLNVATARAGPLCGETCVWTGEVVVRTWSRSPRGHATPVSVEGL